MRVKKREEKDKDLDWIRRAVNISVSQICKDNDIDSANVWHGQASLKSIKFIKNEIIRTFKLLLAEVEDG